MYQIMLLHLNATYVALSEPTLVILIEICSFKERFAPSMLLCCSANTLSLRQWVFYPLDWTTGLTIDPKLCGLL